MSEIRANTVSDAAGTGPATLTGQSAAKALVLYDQVTPAIKSSSNVSSVTDNALGESTVNFTNSFANTTYHEISVSSSDSSAGAPGMYASDDNNTPRTTTAMRMLMINNSNSAFQDRENNSSAFHGDLA